MKSADGQGDVANSTAGIQVDYRHPAIVMPIPVFLKISLARKVSTI
jgi:hypothetical protein